MGRIVFVIVFSGMLYSCQGDDSTEFETEIVGKTWRLTHYINSKGVSVDTNTLLSLPDEHWIVFEEGVLSGRNACNTCSANYEIIDSNSITISDYTCTEMACSGASYLSLYNDNYSYSIMYGKLLLSDFSSDSGTHFTFTAD